MRILIVTIFYLLQFSLSIHAQNLSKVYVLSEGGFSPASSKLSLLDLNNNSFQGSIFNPGQLGLYPDGMILHENYLYILEQGNYGGSGKIFKLDTNGTVINSASVGTNPYSLAISNSKIYITNGSIGKVSVLSLTDFTLLKEITVGVYPQEILSHQNNIFVANTSLWGGASDSTVSVINAISDSVIHNLVVKKDPSSLSISNDGFLLVGCPGDVETGRIFKFNPNDFSLIDTYSISAGGFSKDISLDKVNGDIYFIAYSNDIVKMNLQNNSSSIIVTSVFPVNYFYGYAFDYINQKHYVLDANDFVASGELLVYNNVGVQQQNFATGVAPRRVLLKYNEPVSSTKSEDFAESFLLEQNYPNPFNPTTNISWQMSSTNHVSLKVFDLLGNGIVTLVDEIKNSGHHSIQFNGKGLSSGVYFYVIKSGNYSDKRKMVLLY
jgi:hypothetical protein